MKLFPFPRCIYLADDRHSLTETHEIDSAPTSSSMTSGFVDKITYAFQLAMAQGPLCNEPVQGVAVFVEDVTFVDSAEGEVAERESSGRLTGETIKTVRDSIRQGFLDWSPRLLLAMYSCEIQASSKFAQQIDYPISRIPTLASEAKPLLIILTTP